MNEYLDDKENALLVLANAIEKLGKNPILVRARATVHWHWNEHESALEIYRDIAEHIGKNSPVERAFGMREAAISAANCNQWSLAEAWFLDGHQAAASLCGDKMMAMAIGLRADAAAAALRVGDADRALTQFVNAVEALATLEPINTLAAAYCHRIVRHAILWACMYMQGTPAWFTGQPVKLDPGACSFSEPDPAIWELPLAHIDSVWYMLAELEVSANVDVGINSSLNQRLSEGLIPLLEFSLRAKLIAQAIASLNAVGFVEYLTKYIETTVYNVNHQQSLKSKFSVVEPLRENIPKLGSYKSDDPMVEKFGMKAILAYGISAILTDEVTAVSELENILIDKFGNAFPGKSVFNFWNNEETLLTDLDQVVAKICKSYSRNDHLTARDICLAGLRFFQWIDQSEFRDALTPILAIWLRSRWNQILKRGKFQLSNPPTTVPPIVECLEVTDNNRSFVAKLLRIGCDAARMPLSSEYRNDLIAIETS